MGHLLFEIARRYSGWPLWLRRGCRWLGWLIFAAAALAAFLAVAAGWQDFRPLGETLPYLNWILLALAILLATTLGDALSERLRTMETGLPRNVEDFFRNHDLARVAGESLGMILRDAAGQIGDHGDRGRVYGMAVRAERHWPEIVATDAGRKYLQPLHDGHLTAFIRDPGRPALTPAQAGLLLHLLAPEGAGRKPGFAAAGTEDFVAGQVTRRFGEALREALKADFVRGGKAGPAMLLDVAGELLRTLPRLLTVTEENRAAIGSAARTFEAAAKRLDALDAKARRCYRQVLEGLAATHRAVREEGAASAARDAETHERLARMEAQNREFAEQLREYLAPRQAGEDPTQRQLSPELEAKARELLERGDREQQALAEIALKNHAEADRLIQDLKREPLAEAFRLLNLEGTNWYNAGEFDKAIGPYEQALALWPDDPDARNRAAIAHNQASLGSIDAHQHRAIDLLAGNLALFPNHSPDWAKTQNNLGVAWTSLPTGDRGENLGKAIAAYSAALEVRTRAAHPVDWAMTQNNLGNAWLYMPTGDRGGNLEKAIAAYESALEVRTRAAHPVDWAATQNNLGLALANLPTGDRGDNLGRAIAAYTAALEVTTRAAHRVDWAMTRFNLGLAHIQRAQAGGGCADWRQAIGQVRAAAGVYSEAAFPHVFRENIEPALPALRTDWHKAGCGSDAEFDAIPPAE